MEFSPHGCRTTQPEEEVQQMKKFHRMAVGARGGGEGDFHRRDFFSWPTWGLGRGRRESEIWSSGGRNQSMNISEHDRKWGVP